MFMQKFIFSLILIPLCVTTAAIAQEQNEDEPTPYVIILTGNELLKGLYADGHTQFITSSLSPLGCRCVASLCVGDTRQDLLDALDFAVKHGEFVIVTGGLGPTPDDITRETIAEFTEIPLQVHPDVLENMSRRFNTPKNELRENLFRQTKIPTKGSYLKNTVGTAYGLLFDDGEKVIAAVPGPPSELQPMITNELIPFLAERFGIRTVGASLQMRFVGIGESSIDHTINQELTLPEDLMIGSLFEMGRVDVTFSLPNNNESDQQRLKKLESDLLKHIHEYFYADDGSSLETHVLQLLKARNESIAVAEIGSGGAISAGLSDASQKDGTYLGGYVAPDHESILHLLDLKHETNFSREITEQSTVEIAKRICGMIGSQWAIAVSELIEEENRRFVWVTIGSEKDGFITNRHSIRGRGESAQKRLVTDVLNQLRKRINH